MPNTEVLFLDGGLGTSLEDKYGIKFDETTPLWSSQLLADGRRQVLLACQSDFGRIPVDILLTATYQVSIEGFARAGLSVENAVSCLGDAISIAEEAIVPEARIALSLGPYGACMTPSQEYSGLYDLQHSSTKQLYDWHRERLDVFSQINKLTSRIGFMAFETLPRLDEIIAIRKLFNTRAEHQDSCLSGAVPYWMSCVFPGDVTTLPDGSTIDQVVEAMFSKQVAEVIPWGIGINCTKLDKLPAIIDQYESALARLVDSADIVAWPHLLLYPDGTNGEVYDTTAKVWRQPEGKLASISVSRALDA